MMKLYQFESCPYCRMVREILSDLGITYINVNVPYERSKRHEVFQLSGQYTVPVLEDDGHVIVDEEKIIPYLQAKYCKS